MRLKKGIVFFALSISMAVILQLVSSHDISDHDHLLCQDSIAGTTSIKIIGHIPLPDNYRRIETSKKSFASWLRRFTLKPLKSPVYYYTGELKPDQDIHYAVLDIDVGNVNLQQCADAIMRLRAEYFYSLKKYDRISFTVTSGHDFPYSKWARGYRPRFGRRSVSFRKKAGKDYSYNNFRKYLYRLFQYAGTYSLSRELKRVKSISDIRIGDIFIQGGFPGHAVLVVDMAQHTTSGEKLFLLAQSYMPAQDIHVLKNPNHQRLSPWYSVRFKGKLETPEWVFKKSDLKRF